jgi:hypothetical protein
MAWDGQNKKLREEEITMDQETRERMLSRIFYKCRACGEVFPAIEAIEILNDSIELSGGRHRYLLAIHKCQDNKMGLADLAGWDKSM